jgi:hypothetical protein
MDASTGIALAAFVVAVATFYLTLLRPAEIEIDYAPATTRFQIGGMSDHVPHVSELIVSVYASNLGAHGGLLTAVDVRDFRYEGTGPPFWSGLGTFDLRHYDTNTMVELPIVIQAGDFKTLRLRCVLWEAIRDETDRRTVASIVGGLRAVSIEVGWSFVRTTGLPFTHHGLPRALRRHRSSKTRKDRIRIDATGLQKDLVQQWRQKNSTLDLANLVEGASTLPTRASS